MLGLATRLLSRISFRRAPLAQHSFSMPSEPDTLSVPPYHTLIPGLYVTFPTEDLFYETRSKRHRVAKLKRIKRKYGKRIIIK